MNTTMFTNDLYRELTIEEQEEIIKTEWYIKWMEEVHESILYMISNK